MADSVDEAEISTRAHNCLRSMLAQGVVPELTATALARLSEQELLRWPNLGRRTLMELRDWLAVHGLRFRDSEASVTRASVTHEWIDPEDRLARVEAKVDALLDSRGDQRLKHLIEHNDALISELRRLQSSHEARVERCLTLEKENGALRKVVNDHIAEMERMRLRHRAELEAKSSGTKHLLPASEALERTIAGYLANGVTKDQIAKRLPTWFSQYRAYAGMESVPKLPRPSHGSA